MAMGGSSFPGELDSLVSAVGSDVSQVDPGAAVQAIGDWQSRLESAGTPELSDIAQDLGDLKSQLTGGSLDNTAISQTLKMLGQKVSTLSANDTSGKFSQLADALNQGASSLSGAA